jgi:predicted ATPase/DNA-binding XRE family transcriptional regulator
MDDTALGGLLRRHREAAGLTQEELAERAGVSARTISDVERGLRDGVYRETAARIAMGLGLAGDERALFEAAAQRARRPGRQAAIGLQPAAAPIPPTRLVGREQELAAILASLRDPRVRLVSLTGIGGIGKTRLAVEASAALGLDFPDGVCFVSLAQTSDPRLVAPLVARALGVNPTREPVADLIKMRLGGRRVLLVLDTFEHVLDAAPFVADLLASCSGLTVLATSRAALRLRGEREFAVPPLGVAADGPAATLFSERALAVRGDLKVRGSGAPVVAEICRRLDGVPLAIELAAARVKHLAMAELLDHLDHRLRLLTGGPQDLPLRQQTMRNTLEWSFDLLDDNSQVLFRRLSIFVDWTLESAQLVCGASGPAMDVLTGLSTLIDHSLVIMADESVGAHRYVMLDVVREYAGELRDAAGEAAALADRHAEHFTALAEEAEPGLRRSEQLAWHLTLDADLPNLRQAFRWSLQSEDAERALRLAGAIWMFWLWQGSFVEGRRWLTDALDLPAGQYRAAHAKALWGLGWLSYHQGDYRETAKVAEALLDLALQTVRPLDLRNGLTLRGMAEMAAGRYHDATSTFEQGLAICRRLDEPWLLAASVLNLGNAVMHGGDFEWAELLLGEARSRYRELGDDAYHARATRHLATCQLLRGESQGAAELLRSYEITRPDLGDWDLAESLEELSLINAAIGDSHRAAVLAAAAAAIRKRTSTRPHPFDSGLAEPYLALARGDRNAWDSGWEAGADMPLDEVIKLAGGS